MRDRRHPCLIGGPAPGRDRTGGDARHGDPRDEPHRYHEFLCATLWAGGVVVPVNLRWSTAEIVDSLAEVDARVLVVDDAFVPAVDGIRFVPAVDGIRAGHPGLRHVVHAGDAATPEGMASFQELIAGAGPVEDARRSGDDLPAVFSTGATTGRSKGVVLSHLGLMTSALGTLASEHFLSEDGVYLHAAPVFHLADLALWTAQLVRGGRHVMIPAFEPVAVMTAVQGHGVPDVLLVPTMVQLVVDDPRIDEFDPTSVRRIVYAASPMSEGVLDRAVKALPNARFTQLYGMTELSPVATVLAPSDHQDPVRRRSAGRAAAHAEVGVVGPDDVELPRGQVGEIVVRGAHVVLGYWNRPTETAEALRGAGCTPGTAGTWTTTGSSTSPTGSRT